MSIGDNPILSAASTSTGEIIANLWGGEFTITAAAPATPPDVPPNSRAQVGAGADGGDGQKLDTPDSKGGKMEPGPRGDKAKPGDDGKAPLPKFNLSAYNGGPMRLAGFHYPVVIDASGARFASNPLPIYVGHPAENAPASELIETLVGQGMCACNDGKITACGDITGESATVKQMLTHARNGFKFQNSVHGRPVEMTFIKAGESTTVNGQAVIGPANVVRQSVLDHIAILPLGADTTTSAHIAANHAAGETDMEKFAWIKANYGLDKAGFEALPEAGQKTISAAYDSAVEAEKNAGQKKDPPPIAATGAQSAEDAIKAQNAAVAANLTRIAGINGIEGAASFPAIVAQAVSENWSVEKAENAIIKAQRDNLTRLHNTRSAGGAAATPEFTAAYPRVLEAATLLSCGYKGDLVKDRRYGEKVANMVDDFYRGERSRVVTPSKLARIVARNAGVSLPDGHGDDFWSEALADNRICPRGGERVMSAEFSSLSLPVALSNVMNKFMLDAYLSVDPNDADPAGGVAWREFTRVSSVQDFKPHYRIRMVPTLLLQRLRKGGEIEHGIVGEQSYMLTADTKAIMLGLTRKDLINDDQSVLSTLPTHFGIGAAETVANDIYATLLGDKQSDGSTAFFTASAVTTPGNLMKANLTTSAGLAFTTLEAARARFANQTKPNGQPAGILGRVLLVSPTNVGVAKQLCESDMLIASLSTGGNARGTPANNTLKGLQKPVSSSYLANGAINSLTGTTVSATATDWYLLASATSPAYAIEIGFLNGTEVPVIERAEADFNRLGISFRTFLDYGVALSEPRAAQKQTA